MESLKKKGLELFYQILKLHGRKLPKDLKKLGNAYLKEEFKLHNKGDEIHYKQFLEQWNLYYLQLADAQSLKNIGRNLSNEELNLLNDDQKKTLNELHKNAINPKK